MQIIKMGPNSIIAETLYCIVWAHQGMILGPPDYEGFWWYSIPFLLLIINRIQD